MIYLNIINNMDSIINKIDNFNLNSKNTCVCCYNKYIVEYDYEHSDKLCIICYNNYKEFMLEDNEDYVEIT